MDILLLILIGITCLKLVAIVNAIRWLMGDGYETRSSFSLHMQQR